MSEQTQQQDAAPESAVDTPVPAQEPETVEAGTTEQAAEQEGQQDDPDRVAREAEAKARRARDRINRRFGEVTSQRDQLALQNQQLMQMLMQQGLPQQGRQPATPQDDPPQRGPDEDWESWQDRKTAWRAAQVAEGITKKARQQSDEEYRQQYERQQAQRALQTFASGQAEFAKANPDYHDALVNSEAQLPDGVESLFVEVPESYIAAYAIAKNPKLAEQLWGQTPRAQAATLGRIIATYKAKPAPQVSNAPPPGKPVSAKGAASSSTPADNDSADEWIRKRNAEIARRGE